MVSFGVICHAATGRLCRPFRLRTVPGLAALALALLAFGEAVPARAQSADWRTELPAATGFVNDFAGVVDAASKARMETMARNFRDDTQIEVAVITVASLNGRPIEDVALAFGRQWGVGGGADRSGIVILLSIGDRQSRIEVSRHLEGDVTDGTAGEIVRQSRPQFARGEYGAGLALALESVLATIAEKRGLSIEGIDRARAYQPQSARSRPAGSPWPARIFMLVFLIILILVLVNLARRGGGGRGGGRRGRRWYGGSGWGGPFIGGSWGGGSGGGSSWDGGGGWGGFGGGGDFGGGGASDSW